MATIHLFRTNKDRSSDIIRMDDSILSISTITIIANFKNILLIWLHTNFLFLANSGHWCLLFFDITVVQYHCRATIKMLISNRAGLVKNILDYLQLVGLQQGCLFKLLYFTITFLELVLLYTKSSFRFIFKKIPIFLNYLSFLELVYC